MTPTRTPGQKQFLLNFSPLPWLILTAAFALLWKLGAGSLAAWDEAIYAQVSKEMAQGSDWLTPHWEYKPWFEKPPLLMWVTALLYRVFGISEFWARVPSALSGIALIGVTYSIGKSAYHKNVGFLAAVVLLTCYHFISFSRFGTMEVMLTLFVYLAVYGYLRLRDADQKWWYLVWSSCALALMVKGAGGMIAPAAIMLALVFDGRFKASIQSKHFWLGGALALLIVVPWHVCMYLRYGRAFIDEYIGYHVIARSTRALEGQASSHLYFIGKLVDGFFPWCLLVPFAVVSTLREKLKGQSGSWVLLLLSLFVFGLYTLIPTRRPWYIVPLYPALGILIAAFIVKLYQSHQSRPVYRRIIASACALLIIVGGAYSFISLYLNQKPAEPVARLARLAQSASPDDKDSLLLFSEAESFYAQVPLFYSNRPVEQTYASVKPASEDAERYVHYENLSNATQNSVKRIILRKEDIGRLAVNYEIDVLAEDGSLAYATIRRKL
jgi:4-amino-4-deoxy-L-arabinose transferase-like glycosyltransferase